MRSQVRSQHLLHSKIRHNFHPAKPNNCTATPEVIQPPPPQPLRSRAKMQEPADDDPPANRWTSPQTVSIESTTDSDSSFSLIPPRLRLPLSSSSNSEAPTLVPIDPPEVIIPKSVSHAPILGTSTMNKDGCFTYIHLHQSHHADLLEEFCKDRLPQDDIYVPPDLQPVNPEEEDDVVPDQHAAYGVQKATQKTREPAWRDLGLAELMTRGPSTTTTGAGPTGLMTDGLRSRRLGNEGRLGGLFAWEALRNTGMGTLCIMIRPV
ncbi:hypothetical protein VTJ49DRAFT_454 [Mycothermus thermophilus]|uniref:Anaphase-promoting complex subunit 13 n=1 Tax=Humicola insolens TaxID=85995 RepID=A0ABR3VFH3_HUMIN